MQTDKSTLYGFNSHTREGCDAQDWSGGLSEGGGEIVGVSFSYEFYAVKKAAVAAQAEETEKETGAENG